MIFKVIDNHDPDKVKEFDRFLETTPNGHFMQSSTWGEVKQPTWTPIRVVVKNNTGIMAAAQILKRPLPLIPFSIFYLPRGPVLADYHNLDLWAFVVDNLREQARIHRSLYIKIDPCIPAREDAIAAFLSKVGFRPVKEQYAFGGLQPKYTFRLNIEGDQEEMFNRLPKKIRYKVRYGPRKGLLFKRREAEGLEDFIDVMKKTAERADFVERDPVYYQKVYSVLEKNNMVALITGHYNEQTICASMTFAFGNKAWAAYGAQGNEYRNLYAYHSMIWERIKWAREKGAHLFDFFGVPGRVDESHPLYGLYHFKKSFGGEFVQFLGEYDLPVYPVFYRLWTGFAPRLRAFLLLVKKITRRKNSPQ